MWRSGGRGGKENEREGKSRDVDMDVQRIRRNK